MLSKQRKIFNLLWIIIGAILLITIISVVIYLWLSKNYSGEVDAAIINSFGVIVTFIGTIGVTAYINIQTQKMQLQAIQIQKDMTEQSNRLTESLTIHQSRSVIRDKILEKRFEKYPEIYKKVQNIGYFVEIIGLEPSPSEKRFKDFILHYEESKKELDKLMYDSSSYYISKEVKKLIRDAFFIMKDTVYLELYKISTEKIVSVDECSEDLWKIRETLWKTIAKEIDIEVIEEDIRILGFKEMDKGSGY
ncbi:hypothetical protein SAMN05444392_11059 [Seinonella peptonophila]|uniref:Uncharacterized protein n=1 Tax=Seinonella peptonophila TaxID=112248 RepID=A0A1M4ZR74_9BACL|nr:hypothetical protein [Seinonella peptonophila]SHF20302.1 hypothetical protein SAMN05444392_11059 [Seinonella peptonophila]